MLVTVLLRITIPNPPVAVQMYQKSYPNVSREQSSAAKAGEGGQGARGGCGVTKLNQNWSKHSFCPMHRLGVT
jgi:hypothetical protein